MSLARHPRTGTVLKGASTKRAVLGTLACAAIFITLLSFSVTVTGCTAETGDAALTANTRIELVDWHISGLWVINCPVCWIRVANYNPVPIKDVTVTYDTFDYDGKPLDHGTYTLDGEVGPGQVKNFIEQYVGIVQVESDKISVKLSTVHPGDHQSSH